MNSLFSRGQLDLIRGCAIECTDYDVAGRAIYRTGEATDVWKMIEHISCESWSLDELRVLKFACEECNRQMDNAMSVYHYCQAWDYALGEQLSGAVLNESILNTIAELGVPGSTYRGPGFIVTAAGGAVIGSKPEEIERHMAELSDMLAFYQEEGTFKHWGQTIDPQYLYEKLERIHPRTDGNGRLGKILFNWLKGTLTNPVLPAFPHGFCRV